MHTIVNAIPDIEHKHYLELGLYTGGNYDLVRASKKTGVDIEPSFNATFTGTTDAFFEQLAADVRFDVVYIDACHDFPFVLRDFNNSVAHLAPGGVIFCHDLVPPDEANTARWLCSDAYRFLDMFIVGLPTYQDYYCRGLNDQGLTMFLSPPQMLLDPSSFAELPYATFREHLQRIRIYSPDEMRQIAGAL